MKMEELLMEELKGKAYGHRSSKSDFYETPYSITEQLVEKRYSGKLYKDKIVLEPASGNGAIVKILRKYFYHVESYDKETNFLKEEGVYPYIITNPPYSLADEFVMRAKEVYTDKFSFLLRTNFLSGYKRYRAGIFKGLQFVDIFTRMPDLRAPIREDGKYPTAMNVYAWMTWQIGYKGKPQIDWIDNQKYVLKKGE